MRRGKAATTDSNRYGGLEECLKCVPAFEDLADNETVLLPLYQRITHFLAFSCWDNTPPTGRLRS